MIYKREIFKKIERCLLSPEVLVLTGMRRTGKTTVLKYLFDKIESKNKLFLDIERPLNQEILANRDYEAVKLSFEKLGINFNEKNYIFLDEIQFLKNAPSLIKYIYDHYKTKFVVTGSASFYLKNLFSESLAGRKYLFELYPLSFKEFLWFKNIDYKLVKRGEKVTHEVYGIFSTLFEEYLTYGGFPQVVLKSSHEEKNDTLNDIFTAYFQKEVQQLADFKDNAVIRNLVLLLTERIGQRLDISKLASEMGVSRPTIYEYLEYLQGTYLIDLVPAYGKPDVALRKQSKVYFADTGLLNILGKVASGNLFENSVFLKLKRDGCVSYLESEFNEVDFIAEETGYEAKLFPSSRDLVRLERIARKIKLKDHYLFSYKYSAENKVLYGFQEI